MSQNVERLIKILKELEINEKKIKDHKSELFMQFKHLEEELDQIYCIRSQTLMDLELANKSSSDQSESEFQSLNSDNSFYPKSSDMDSDDFTNKRKERSDSNVSDISNKKVRSSGITEVIGGPNTVEEVNDFNQEMVDKCIDEMAAEVRKEMSGSDIKLKNEFEKLSEDPDFESLVKSVEREMNCETISKIDSLTQTSPSLLLTLYRSNSTDGNFKENTSPSSRVRRSSSNRFKFDQQNIALSQNNSNSNSDSPSFAASNVLKGKKLLSSLLSEKESIDEKRDKSFTQKVETSNCFRDKMMMWERKATEDILINRKSKKKVRAIDSVQDIVDSI